MTSAFSPWHYCVRAPISIDQSLALLRCNHVSKNIVMQCATTKQRQDDFEQPIPMRFAHLDLAETYLFTHSLIVKNLSIT